MSRITLLLLAAAFAGPARAQVEAGDEEVPVTVAVTVDDADLATTGIFRFDLSFMPLADVGAAYVVRLVVGLGTREIIVRDHVPDPPTKRWRKGRVVRYALDTAFPKEMTLAADTELEVRIGFFDPERKVVLPPAESWPYGSGLAPVAEMKAPRFDPVDSTDRIDALIARARDFKAAGRTGDAWDVLELGLRLATEDDVKYRFRDELLKLGDLPPRPVSIEEQRIVDARVQDEKVRHLRLEAGRMFDRRLYRGALALLTIVGGTLAEAADEAVIGALDDAKRAEQDLEDVRTRLYEEQDATDAADVQKAAEDLGLTRKLLDRADAWTKKGRHAAARALYKKLRYSEDRTITDVIYARIEACEKAMLASMPREEQAAVDAALDHPCWGRTVILPTHRFLFIGPKRLLDGIPAKSKLHFDLAYVFLTDLFGRVPNPGGDRVTVYFKELWDFGGGVGGGKIIDIGRADPEAKDTRVDTGLFYHELTHCIDDTNPIFDGFREGLANLGAAYCFEALAQKGDGLHSFESNLDAFRRDYLARDLEYWRIPNYGPSAGFFLHFLEAYSKSPHGHDWKPYRRFFRDYRAAPVRDGREPFIARAFAFYLMRAFGPRAFDDLVSFRWPLRDADRVALGVELEAFERGQLDAFRDAFEEFPNSPLPRDLLYRELLRRAGKDDPAAVERFGHERLGLIYDWKVIGPFSERGVDPGAAVFPPESDVDYAKQYTVQNNICSWRDPQTYAPVIRTPIGWIAIEFNYQVDTATYALCHVTVDAPTDAVAHLRADDDLFLFVNDERVGSYHERGANGSSHFTWRGPYANVPDAIRLPVRLVAGRNKLLVKVRNRYGPAGFACALTRLDGTPVENLRVDTEPPAATATSHPDAPAHPTNPVQWSTLLRQSFKSSLGGKIDATVGRFEVRNKALFGASTDKRVAWRKYTVRPGFPKDSPSNLAWIKERSTEDVDDFRLVLAFERDGDNAPKVLVTFMGEGNDDGLSGWTLILVPGKGGELSARLERYDRLVFQTPAIAFEPRDENELELIHVGRRASVRFNDSTLFDAVPIRPIPNRHRVGFATWGSLPRIRSLTLEAAK